MPLLAYIIVCDGSVDQVCETRRDANREARELRQAGHTVSIRMTEWTNQDFIINQIEGFCHV